MIVYLSMYTFNFHPAVKTEWKACCGNLRAGRSEIPVRWISSSRQLEFTFDSHCCVGYHLNNFYSKCCLDCNLKAPTDKFSTSSNASPKNEDPSLQCYGAKRRLNWNLLKIYPEKLWEPLECSQYFKWISIYQPQVYVDMCSFLSWRNARQTASLVWT